MLCKEILGQDLLVDYIDEQHHMVKYLSMHRIIFKKQQVT